MTRTVRMADINVSTNQYEFAHGGRKPRGYGHWAFEFGAAICQQAGGGQMHFYAGRYSEAKRQAMRDAQAEGVIDIEVGA